MADDAEQRNGGDGGQRNRQINLHQRAHVARAVDQRRFFQRGRHLTEEVQHQNQIEYRQRSRQHQRPDGIPQAQLGNQQVVGNHAAAHQHGNEEVPRVHIAEVQLVIALGQRVRRQNDEEQVQTAAQQHPDNGGAERRPEAGAGQNVGVGAGGPALGPEVHLIAVYVKAVAEGNGDYVDEGQQADQRQRRQHNDVHHSEYLAARAFLDMIADMAARLFFRYRRHEVFPLSFQISGSVRTDDNRKICPPHNRTRR